MFKKKTPAREGPRPTGKQLEKPTSKQQSSALPPKLQANSSIALEQLRAAGIDVTGLRTGLNQLACPHCEAAGHTLGVFVTGATVTWICSRCEWLGPTAEPPERVGTKEASRITGLSQRVLQARWHEVPGGAMLFGKISFDIGELRRWVSECQRTSIESDKPGTPGSRSADEPTENRYEQLLFPKRSGG